MHTSINVNKNIMYSLHRPRNELKFNNVPTVFPAVLDPKDLAICTEDILPTVYRLSTHFQLTPRAVIKMYTNDCRD